MSLVYNSNKFQYAVSQSLPFGEVRRGFPFNAFNCMKAYSYNGERYGYYGYDASGERTYKYDIFSADSWTNQNGGMNVSLQIDKMMLYPNGYLNMNQNGEYTKHYYADALRIASKIGSGFTGNLCDSATATDYSGYLNARITFQSDIMVDELNEVVVPLQDIQQINPIPYPTFCNLGPGGQETNLFFYHPDHLGSTGMVTDNNASVVQGLLYAPFGEVISDYNPSFHDTLMPNFAFNAKELDEENGMYYYSARYYAPPTFISRDVLFEEKPFISPYAYCANNPMKFVDPTGESMEEGDGDPPKNGQYSPSNTKSNTAIKVPYAIPNTETKAESKTQTTGSNTSSTLSPTTKQSVNNSSQSYAGGVSIEGTIAVGAVGYTIELGMVMDSKGEVMPFLSSGKASGYEASIGANGFIIPSKDFDVKDFVGKSMSINISAGDFSASYITDHSQGETKDYYQKNYYGLKVGVGAGIGASISHTKTEKVSLPAVPLDVLNRPGRR